MKILFVSSSPLNKEISIGNTFINLFSDMENVELASIYTRSGTPDKEISQAFCITEKVLVNNLIKKTPVGVYVESRKSDEAPKVQNTKKEQSIIDFIKTRRWIVFFWLQDFIWKIGRWKSPELKKFVEDYNPDIVFTLLSDSSFLNRLILHVTKLANKKLVLYAWDNNYSFRQFYISPLRWIRHINNRRTMRKVAEKADLFYVISNIQKNEYERIFNKECKILTKSADFSGDAPIKSEYNKPLQLVFTGNIATNRWKTLALIVDALKEINKDEIKAQLNIYTTTPLTKKMMEKLNVVDTSVIRGAVPASEVSEIQKEADIVVQVEGFDLRNRCLLHQSFSTKIVDYCKEARPIFAVAPHDVASIDELRRNSGAMIATKKKEIKQKLEQLIKNKETLDEYSIKAYMCGKQNYSNEKMKNMLFNDLKCIFEKSEKEN